MDAATKKVPKTVDLKREGKLKESIRSMFAFVSCKQFTTFGLQAFKLVDKDPPLPIKEKGVKRQASVALLLQKERLKQAAGATVTTNTGTDHCKESKAPSRCSQVVAELEGVTGC